MTLNLTNRPLERPSRPLAALAAAGSAALLLGALGFQYIGGYAPCHLCILQRWPHLVAVLLGLVVMLVPNRLLMVLGALAAATSGAIALFHTGVERHWWQGPTTCTSDGVAGMSSGDLMSQIMNAPLVQCDQIAWAKFGLSMANYNLIASALLALLWLVAATRRG